MGEVAPVAVQDVLGPLFRLDHRKSIGAAHSGHGVVFGSYAGIEVAAKPFAGNKSRVRASYEMRMLDVAKDLGVKALQPVDIVHGDNVSILLTHYERGLIGASGLSLEAPTTSETGVQVAESMSCIAVELAELHDKDTTHGDPQGKNFGFKVAEVTSNQSRRPWVFDLEKAAQHGRTSPYREGAMRRDWKRFTFTLGSRRYGGRVLAAAKAHVIETVLEPYVETRLAAGKCPDNLTNLIEYALENFENTRRRYQGISMQARRNSGPLRGNTPQPEA